ncbi:MAG: Xaa-Pro dipeptidase [Gammaproteobacteria bacterium]
MSTVNTGPPPRGFSERELANRTERAQRRMRAANIDALLLTTEPEFRYFSGFHSQFWESPTRPWFLVVPATGKPIAVIPEIGVAGVRQTWLEDIRTWPAPRPEDDGVSDLARILREEARTNGRIGVPMGHESTLRMPAADFAALTNSLRGVTIVDARPLIRELRATKSDAEIAKISYACHVTCDAFQRLPLALRAGMSERQACKALQLDVLSHGADSTPYLIGASGPGSYDNIIMGPSDRTLDPGDILVIDTGTTFDGYFCDFDRNFAFGHATDDAHRAYAAVFAATEAGYEAARPGATTSDIWRAMWQVLEAAGALGNDIGRMGHGLGMQLTEWPSNRLGDDTELVPGMVLTLEPGMIFSPGQLMVHEENIVIRDGPAQWLTRRAPEALTVIE